MRQSEGSTSQSQVTLQKIDVKGGFENWEVLKTVVSWWHIFVNTIFGLVYFTWELFFKQNFVKKKGICYRCWDF